MKNLWLAFILSLVLVVGCARHSTDDEGGADGGGGNTVADKPVPDGEFAILKSEGKAILRAVLNYHATLYLAKEDADSPEAENILKIYARLFPKDGSANVFAELRETEFNWIESGPCKDKNSEDKDGAAFTENEKEICISLDRVKPKLTQQAAVSVTVGLYAHEIAHRMGAGEDEAVLFQKTVAATLSAGSVSAIMIYLHHFEGLKQSKAINSQLNKLKPTLESDLSQLCLDVNELTKQVTDLSFPDVGLDGIRAVSVQSDDALPQVKSQAERLNTLCATDLKAASATAGVLQLTKELDVLRDLMKPIFQDLLEIHALGE